MEEDKKKKIAVVGDEEFTLGFELAGVQRTYGTEDYSATLKELMTQDDLGIVVVEEDDIDQLSEKVRRKVEGSVDPVFVSLSEESGISGLEQKIKNVIGIDIS